MQKNDKFSLALASTLNLDNTPLEPAYNAVSNFVHLSLRRMAMAALSIAIMSVSISQNAEENGKEFCSMQSILGSSLPFLMALDCLQEFLI